MNVFVITISPYIYVPFRANKVVLLVLPSLVSHHFIVLKQKSI